MGQPGWVPCRIITTGWGAVGQRHGDEAVEAYGHVAKAAVRGKAFLDNGRFAQIVFDGRGQIAHLGKIRF